jgi:hypothetical protein
LWPLPARTIARWGAWAAGLLCLAGLLPLARPGGYYVPELDVGAEGSIAAWLSSSALLACAAALAWLARRDGPARRRAWWGLALVFACLSLDEAASVHEKAIDPLQSALGTSGPLLYAWVIPGAVAVGAVGLAFVPFLRRLERATAGLFLAAGGLYVGGALGFEVLSGALAPESGPPGWPYVLVATTEELLEMLGITLFLASTARYSATALGRGRRSAHGFDEGGGEAIEVVRLA